MELTASGFGSALLSALPEMRIMAEARMLDDWDIKVEVGKEYSPTTKKDETVWELLFSTKGRVKVSDGLAAREVEVGGRTSVSVVRVLSIPVDSPVVPTGAVAFNTSVHPSSDPTLAGARLRLDGPAPGSQTTARRLQVSEVLT